MSASTTPELPREFREDRNNSFTSHGSSTDRHAYSELSNNESSGHAQRFIPSSNHNISHDQPRTPRQPLPRTNPVTDMFNARIQLSEAFFRRVAMGYARLFPLTARRIIEFGFLVQAFFVLGVFIHLHLMFVRSPITCLDKLRTNYEELSPAYDTTLDMPEAIARNHYAPGDPNTHPEPWPRYGVLRVEVIRHPDPRYSLADSYAKEFYGSALDYGDEINDIFTTEDVKEVNAKSEEHDSTAQNAQDQSSSRPKLLMHETRKLWHVVRSAPSRIRRYFFETIDSITGFLPFRSKPEPPVQPSVFDSFGKHYFVRVFAYMGNTFRRLCNAVVQFFHDASYWFNNFHVPAHEDNHIIEYALEYGFLRLSPGMRKRLNITVKLVVLDPAVDACFGGVVSRFLMEEFLGYDDLLLGSIKHLAVSESVKGHMANVVSGQHYRLVSAQMSRSSYLVATLVMLLFTFCVSVLLRYSSHQLVLVIADILQVFETNVAIGIPATPFMTVILALVAIETIMSEFFGDSFTAFYVILIVSICDHYEAIFCRTEISRRYWPRFFYLYHVAFYAYHYRFNGQFSSMALWVSWLFTLHSMIYFFHHYELPNLLSDWELREFFNHIGSGEQVVGHLQIQLRTQPWSGAVEIIQTSESATFSTEERDTESQELDQSQSDEMPPLTDDELSAPPLLTPGGDMAVGSEVCQTGEKPCISNSTSNQNKQETPELPSEPPNVSS